MTQVTAGIRRVLSLASAYDWFQTLVGARGLYRLLATEYLRVRPGDVILDIGCGPASILGVLPAGVAYYGFDLSERYIAAARRRWGARGHFRAERVSEATLRDVPPCDVVLACGVLHHLDDQEADALFDIARRALVPGGRCITYDCCFTDEQSLASRALVSLDRGQRVRRADAYAALARAHFTDVAVDILDGHLRIPYTSAVVTSRGPRPLAP